jgi:hypothetical protein
MHPSEVHARLSDGQSLRMTRRQYVAALLSAELGQEERDDLASFYRKHDIRLVGE